MKNIRNNKIPVILSIIILGIVLIVNLSVRMSSAQRARFETFSNVMIFINAVVSFFWSGLPFKEKNDRMLGNVLGNIVVPISAFLMNIGVFGHAIRKGHLLDDLLWGWHICWIICAVIQILFLTELWKNLQFVWHKCWGWWVKVIRLLGEFFLEIIELIKETAKIKLLIIIGGIILWIIYFRSRASSEKIDIVLSDTKFLLGSIFLWGAYIIVYLLVRYAMDEKNGKPKPNVVNGKKILAIIGGAIALLIFCIIYPLLQELLVIMSLLLAAPAGIIAGILKRKRKKMEEGRNNSFIYVSKPRETDMIVLVVSYLIVPLIIIILFAVFMFGGEAILAKESYKPLDFIMIVIETVNNLLQLFV